MCGQHQVGSPTWTPCSHLLIFTRLPQLFAHLPDMSRYPSPAADGAAPDLAAIAGGIKLPQRQERAASGRIRVRVQRGTDRGR